MTRIIYSSSLSYSFSYSYSFYKTSPFAKKSRSRSKNQEPRRGGSGEKMTTGVFASDFFPLTTHLLTTHFFCYLSVCASTEYTAGRSRTMAVQLLPASAEAYTCPPVVPKYMPQGSSVSTDDASRKMLT